MICAVVRREHTIEAYENQHICQINDRDNHARKQLRRVGHLCLQIYGNHTHGDRADDEDDCG